MAKTVRAGGKLYIAGEYSVLYPGQAAILKHIPIYLKARIEKAEEYRIFSDLFEKSVDLSPDKDYHVLQETIKVMNDFLVTQAICPRPFSLNITGKMERSGKKFGIGSSGSAVIVTIRAMLAFYEIELSQELIFKLAAYILLHCGDNGSMGDIACITYEDLIFYRSFDRSWLAQYMKSHSLQEVLEQDWGYEIRRIHPQLAFDFLIGWTKEPAISKDLIKAVSSAIHPAFLQNMQKAVEEIERGLVMADKELVSSYLEEASRLLSQLSPAIYSESLYRLRAAAQGLDCVAKSSGAGGGDCGIAFSFTQTATCKLKEHWQEKDIELLYEERIGEDE